MIKRYCDLCGKEVESDGKRIEVAITKIYGKNEPKITKMPLGMILDDEDAEQEHYDVCTECSERLAKFLSGLKKGE